MIAIGFVLVFKAQLSGAKFYANGVLALHPMSGVSSRPPRRASAGSSGTAEVARKLARLLRSSTAIPPGFCCWQDLQYSVTCVLVCRQPASGLAVWSAAAVVSACCTRSGVACSWVISTSSDWTGICPVTIIKPALISALDSVIRRTLVGNYLHWPSCDAALDLLKARASECVTGRGSTRPCWSMH